MEVKWRMMVAPLVLLSSFALAQDAAPATEDAPATSAAADRTSPGKQAAIVPPSQTNAEYVIGPEDVLHVAVWKEADLTATLPVRPDGKISLPLLNDVQASGLTPQQLAASLTEKLKKYIADPHVTVVVTTINSKRIYLVG